MVKGSFFRRCYVIVLSVFFSFLSGSAANWLCFTAEESGSEFWYKNRTHDPDVQYSVDGGESWQPLEANERVVLEKMGDKAFLRGINPNGFTWSDDGLPYQRCCSFFGMNGAIAASGSVMSLIDGDGSSTIIPSNACFWGLFYECEALSKAPELPATTLTNSCYEYMFSGCSSLTEAPELPAMTLADGCYGYMFSGCSSLTEAPKLPATTLKDSCYISMFLGCSSLTEAPELPATTMARYCYSKMFSGCSSLVEAPELPAMFLARYCYSEMFSGCSSLAVDPELPATSLMDMDGCYSGMFSGCSSLMRAPELPALELAWDCYSSMFSGCSGLLRAPDLPATELVGHCYTSMFSGCSRLTRTPELPATIMALACYESMFSGCSSLRREPKLPATELVGSCYKNMFSGCSSLTRAPELPATELLVSCYSGMFSGCSSLTEAPELPATTMAYDCYSSMFSGCSSLTQAPELPATILAKGCYQDMFKKCVSLTRAPELPANSLMQDCYKQMFLGCSNLNYIKVGVLSLDSVIGGNSYFFPNVEKFATTNWVAGVDGPGIFIFPCGSTYDKHGDSEVPPLFEIRKQVFDVDTLIVACDSFVYAGTVYREDAEWSDTLTSVAGCDSIVLSHLVIHTRSVTDTTIIADEQFTWEGVVYTDNATWSDTLQTVSGCDSIVNYNLLVHKFRKLHLTVDDDLILVLPGGQVMVGYDLSDGVGSKYEIRYQDKQVCGGAVENDSTVLLDCPSDMEPGTYVGTLVMFDAQDGKAEAEFVFNVMLPDDKENSYYVKVWNDVVICRNGEGLFEMFQWYKDRQVLEDATFQYYNDLNLLDGEYMVYVNDKYGKSYFIEPCYYQEENAEYVISVHPSVVNRGAEFTLTVSGVEPDQMENARIVVYRNDGSVMRVLDKVEEEMTMNLWTGDYVIMLTVNDGKVAYCKVLVK